MPLRTIFIATLLAFAAGCSGSSSADPDAGPVQDDAETQKQMNEEKARQAKGVPPAAN
jgi:type IV pilus biogenesis protein CpaD/CtpE